MDTMFFCSQVVAEADPSSWKSMLWSCKDKGMSRRSEQNALQHAHVVWFKVTQAQLHYLLKLVHAAVFVAWQGCTWPEC